MADDVPAPEPIAIVGLACRFPGANSPEQFWQNIIDRVESITPFSDSELAAAGVSRALLDNPRYVRAGAVLDDIEGFDAALFGISAREAELMDPQHRLFLECCWEALEDANLGVRHADRRVGVFAGCNTSLYLLNQFPRLGPGEVPEAFEQLVGNDKDYLATRVSYRLDLRGPSVSVGTACSTSLVAVALACQALHAQSCDAALAGAVCLNVPHRTGYLHRDAGGSLSADGHCRAFDAAASGAMLGNGVGVVVLKRLSDAQSDDDCILSVIRGYALSNDGSEKVGFMAPSARGYTTALREALDFAGIDASTIGYVEAHGTGTAMGDPIEVAALTAAFRVDTGRCGYCGLGSVKTNIGHAGQAAGMAGLIKTTLALSARTLPPSLHFERPNPALRLGRTPFFVVTESQPWSAPGPRRAIVSSLGIGGTNASLILEEAQADAVASRPALRDGPDRSGQSEDAGRCQLLPLSANSKSALELSAQRLAEHLERNPTLGLASVARSLQSGRRPLSYRGYVVARSRSQAIQQLRERRRSNWARRVPADAPQVVFAFSGMGLVAPEVLQPLAASFAELRRQLAAGATYARELLGFDLSGLLFGAQDGIRDQQPLAARSVALLVVECALARLLISLGVHPSAVIGHSSGEFAAACISGALDLRDAVELVGRRAELACELPREGGGMLTVNLPAAEISRRLGGAVEFAAFNADDVTLLAGSDTELVAWQRELAGSNVVCQRSDLPFAAHSRFVEPALAALGALGDRFEMRMPRTPWISTVTGLPIADERELADAYWPRQARNPVRFAQAVGHALAVPGRVFIEIGPGAQLSSLIMRVARGREVPHVALGTLAGGAGDAVEFLLGTLGRLWALGVGVAFDALGAEGAQRVRLPHYPFEHKRYWVERAAEAAPAAAHAPRLQRPIWTRCARPLERSAEPDATLLVRDGSPWCDELERALRAVVARVDEVADALRNLVERGPRSVRVLVAKFDISLSELATVVQGVSAAKLSAAIELCILTRNAQCVLGSETIDVRAAGSCVAALVAPRELPQVTGRAIDVDNGTCARDLLEELRVPAGFHAVAYRDGKRWQRGYVGLEANHASGAFKQAGVYVITGGLGRLGQILVPYLAEVYGARIVLTHTRVLPDRREWRSRSASGSASRDVQWLLALEEAGATVRTACVDAADRTQMRALFADVQASWGAIHGVVHLAGNLGPLAFVPICDVDQVALDQHFHAKVAGAQVLSELFAEFPVEFCCLASSIAAELGGFGNYGYGAANRALDALAEVNNGRHGVRWLSVNWDVIRPEDLLDLNASEHAGTLLTPGVRALLAQGALRAADFPGLLECALATPEYAQLIAWAVPFEVRVARMQRPRDTVTQRPDLTSAYVPPTSELERALVEIWESVLGIKPIGIEDSFFELGGDSLVAVRLASQCTERLGLNVPMSELVREPTIAGVCRAVEKQAVVHELFARRSCAAPRHNVVCVPFLGGSVFSYEALCQELPADYAVWVVPPLREVCDPERLFERALEQIAAFEGPVSIYGHCGGVVAAMELTRRIEAQGGSVLQLFAGGIFPDSAKHNGIDLSADMLRSVDDTHLFGLVQTLGGLPGALTADEIRLILGGFREDAERLGRYFEPFARGDSGRLRAPIACLVGTSDPVTHGWQDQATQWRRYCTSSSTHAIEDAGHYFVTTHAAQVARIVTSVLDARDRRARAAPQHLEGSSHAS